MLLGRSQRIWTCILTALFLSMGVVSDSHSSSVQSSAPFLVAEGVRLPAAEEMLSMRWPGRASISTFTGVREGKHVRLEWLTTSEVNNQGFDVQRASSDSRGWERLIFVPGSGNSRMEQRYSHEDRQAPPEDLRYMLRVLGNDGTVQYSQIITVAAGSVLRSLIVRGPTDTFGKFYTAEIELSDEASVSIHLLDQMGNILVRTMSSQPLKQGRSSVPIDCSQLPEGSYELLVFIPDGRVSRTLSIK
jgi:hypothetical protein